MTTFFVGMIAGAMIGAVITVVIYHYDEMPNPEDKSEDEARKIVSKYAPGTRKGKK